MAREPFAARRSVSALTLRHTLAEHTDAISQVAWSPDGTRLATASADNTVIVWDAETGQALATHRSNVMVHAVAWDPGGESLAFETASALVGLPSAVPAQRLSTALIPLGRGARSIAWSPEQPILAIADSGAKLHLLNQAAGHGTRLITLDGFGRIHDVCWAPHGSVFAVASTRVTLCRFGDRDDVGLPGRVLYDDQANGVAFAPDGEVLAVAATDATVRIYDITGGPEQVVLEGHTGQVSSVAFSCDGRLLASKSLDGTVRLWDSAGWRPLGVIEELPAIARFDNARIAFHPTRPDVLATLGDVGTSVRVWELDLDRLLASAEAPAVVHYTTAKVVLVGDAGVGKTGLGWRLAHGAFKEHASTHGQQFWVLDQLGTTRDDGTEGEAVLWDLAGQHVYRSVHAIFLDDVDAALVLFDPTNRQDPLKGVRFWLEQLGGREHLPPTILVGARSDRGSSVLSREEIEQFCQAYGIGVCLSVSALTASGVPELVETLRRLIPWDRMGTTVTTVTFKRIKQFVLALKERPDLPGVLVTPGELRERLRAGDPGWSFTDDEMMGAVRHLQTHGYVAILRSSSGAESILLAPDLLVDLAASIALLADRHPRELAAIDEADLLRGEYPMEELAWLSRAERRTLVEAAVLRFVEHNVCFREVLGTESLLIFPGLIKQRRPLVEAAETVDDISYVVRGRVENVYAALVVQLGYTPSFTRVDQWQNQAQYELEHGAICGFRQVEDREGEIELVLYYSTGMPEYGKRLFQGSFEQFLHQRDVEITPYPPVICPDGHRQERATVIRRARERKTFLFCDECGAKAALPATDRLDRPRSSFIQREGALARLRTSYETGLVPVKSFRRDRAAPRCYLSHVPEQAGWAAVLAQDLREAGVRVLTGIGELTGADLALVVSSPAYRKAWQSPGGPLRAELPVLRDRMRDGQGILELTRAGDDAAFDFRDDTRYPVVLFDLVLTLYAIPWSNPVFAAIRHGLREQHGTGPSLRAAAKVFVSYAHEDEPFKDALGTMLSLLQRQGVLEFWHDRRIEPGASWRAGIEAAAAECDMAILLVSPDFLASSFIQDEELPTLLRRRLTVVPVIVRPCPWADHPALAGLQALPRDARPVITFPAETGARDQAWTDVVAEIRARLIG